MGADGRADQPENQAHGERRQGADPDRTPVHRPSLRRHAARRYDHVVLIDIDIRTATCHNSSLLMSFHLRLCKARTMEERCGRIKIVRKFAELWGLVAYPRGEALRERRKPCTAQDKSSALAPLG